MENSIGGFNALLILNYGKKTEIIMVLIWMDLQRLPV
jgi:hypothetical protein